MNVKTLKVEEHEYKLVPMSPWEGSEYAAKLAALITKALAGEAGGILAARDQVKEGGVADPNIILSMVTRLLPHIPAAEFTGLARQALIPNPATNHTGVECPDGPLDQAIFDQWFGKHQGEYFPVAIWAIKENAAGFFVKGGPAWSAVAAALLPSQSPTTD